MTRIIEWVIGVATSGIEPETPILSEDKEAAKACPFLDSQEKKPKTFQLLRARSAYISSIAHTVDEGLNSAVDDSTEKLQNQVKSLHEYRRFVEEYKAKKRSMDVEFLKSKAAEVANNNNLLYESAIKVTEEVSQKRLIRE